MISSLFILAAIFSFYYFYSRDEQTVLSERLLEHCIEENTDTLRCYVFIQDFKKEQDRTCLDIVLPEIDVERRDISICFDTDIEWENPYDDYSFVVPVILTLHYENPRRTNDSPINVEMDLMEDERVYEILEEIFYTEGEAVRVMTKDVYTHIEQGYRYFVDWSSREGDRLLFLGINNSKIKSIENDGESIVMEISF